MTDESRNSRNDAQAPDLASEHIDTDTLERYAAQTLSAPVVRVVREHLRVCNDGRCVAFVQSLGAAIASTRSPPTPPADGVRPRTFQAREVLWATFETWSTEQKVPVGELVTMAMAAYARVRGYSVSSEPMPSRPEREHRAPTAQTGLSAPTAPTNELPAVDPLPRVPPHQSSRATPEEHVPTMARRSAAPERNDITESRTTPRARESSPVTKRPRLGDQIPPDRPSSTDQSLDKPSSSSAKRLVLTYRGQTHPVDKDRYLLGRSKTQADLRLDDPNVSRQHAVIERVGAAWYIVDLGSTNGVHVAKERVARRALTDGDVIVITNHEIRCSLR